MEPLSIGLLGLLAMFVLIALHVPIGIAMAFCGVAGVAILVGWQPEMALFSIEAASSMSNESLAVVAIFLVMGSFANLAGLSRDLYRLAYALIGHRPGGLCTATIFGCAGFGAVCGSSVATTATMARIALPEMRKRGYSLSLACGAIASGGLRSASAKTASSSGAGGLEAGSGGDSATSGAASGVGGTKASRPGSTSGGAGSSADGGAGAAAGSTAGPGVSSTRTPGS